MFLFCKMKSESLMGEGGGAKLKITILKIFEKKPSHIDMIQFVGFSEDIRKKEKADFYKWDLWSSFYCNLNSYLLLKVKKEKCLIIEDEIFVE